MMMLHYGISPTRSIFSFRNFIKHLPVINTVSPLSVKFNTFCSAIATPGAKFSYCDSLNARQKDQIFLYVDALLHCNQKMNLTAVRKPDDVMERHVEDSLAIILPIQNSYSTYCKGLNDNINVVDVGTGAGLPGIVLAIACPGQNLGQNQEYREVLYVAVARAVAEMRILAEYCPPLVRLGGLFVAAKGHDPMDEVKNAERAVQMM